MQWVKREIETRGPLSSLDLEEETRVDWWLSGSTRAVRIALDMLFTAGEIVVHHRRGSRRYFDLTRRVLPPGLRRVRRSHASQDAYLEWHVLRRSGGVGLVYAHVNAKWGGILGWRGGQIRAALTRLLNKGRLVRVAIDGLPRKEFYARRDDLPALEAAGGKHRPAPGAAFIAPLDNLMWDGDLIRMLFDFFYTWEVYSRRPGERGATTSCPCWPATVSSRAWTRRSTGGPSASPFKIGGGKREWTQKTKRCWPRCGTARSNSAGTSAPIRSRWARHRNGTRRCGHWRVPCVRGPVKRGTDQAGKCEERHDRSAGVERTRGPMYVRRAETTGVSVPAALAAGIGAGIVAGLVNLAILVLTHSHIPPLRATFWSSVVAGALAGLVYAMWTRISPRPVAALWLTSLLVATADTIVIFALPFPTAGRHLGLGFIAGITTPLLQILALFGVGGFGRGHMSMSYLGIYLATHYVPAVVASALIPLFVRPKKA